MGKVKVINGSLNQNLNGGYFNDTPSNTIFSFGRFFVTSNFDNKVTIDYTNTLSSFVRPVTLETMGVSDVQSEISDYHSTNATLNLDKSDLNTFVRYGSAYEFLRISIQNIILAYPGSLFANSQTNQGGNVTFEGLSFDEIENICTFYVPIAFLTNTFGLVINNGNETIPDDNKLKNLNLSYNKYVIWSNLESDILYPIVEYTGNTVDSANNYTGTLFPVSDYLKLQVTGNPFESLSGTTGNEDYHIRPNNVNFEEFRALLNSFEMNIVGKREGTNGFSFILKDPTQLENGKITYSDTKILWNTGDKYNIDTNTPTYQNFLKIVLRIGAKYDEIKTDLIARFLTPASLKVYDFTDEGKVTKLLRLYGREFDQMRQFIDSLVYINKVTYDKINNIPDQLVKNLANTFGWEYFSILNEEELVDGFLTVDDTERDLNENILPAEIDIELWRRILNNTNYFWKSKGTRQAIKSIFMLIGIPEPFINITEYVYTVDGKINPNTVVIPQEDFPSNSLPYDTEGYPIAPLETNDFFFQISGNTDSGQDYLNVFRNAGFNLKQTSDNKKSWIQTGEETRQHYSTPQYYQEDSKLVINTKEVDIALDTSQAIEFNVYEYIQKDFAANSSGYTMPYSYVNISLGADTNPNEFHIPTGYMTQGDFEVRYNGILLNAPSISGITGSTLEADYIVSGDTFTIPELSGGTNPGDIIQVTFVNSGSTASPLSGVSVQYIVTRVQANATGTYIPLPEYPRGDVQVTINGIALTKGTSQFTADYILDPANWSGSTNNRLIIQNPDVITFLNANPDVQIALMKVTGSNNINMRSEIVRVDSFNSSKIYFNNSANKYVFKLNYKVNDASEVKFLVNGIALEPLTDYSINVQNPYEIFLPKGIRYGAVISAYYIVGDYGAFTPVIDDLFGLGDISQLSFLEFLELIQRKMINAKNRKTVTDFKGGWYPAVLAIYEKYLERVGLPNDDPLHSNGYTFYNLYPFLNKYNAFFQRFIDQLLPATIIQKRGGLLIRNTIFTKQKHWYKRGVNVGIPYYPDFDLRGNMLVQHLGDDGSMFQIYYEGIAPPVPVPPELYVETTPGVLGSIITGGQNITGYDVLTEYGIDYKKDYETNWSRIFILGALDVDNYSMTIIGLDEGATYDYRAYIQSDIYGYSGTSRQQLIPESPSLETAMAGSVGITAIYDTGGFNVVRYADVDYYGMEYMESGGGTWLLYPTTAISVPLGSNNHWQQDIEGLIADTTYEYRAYMSVDGTLYYGNTRIISTNSIPTNLPNIVTISVTNVTETTADVTGNITNIGVPTNTQHGIVWGANSNPTIANSKTELGIGSIGAFIDTIGDAPNGLVGATTYHARAYVTNSVGTSYGADILFETATPPPTPVIPEVTTGVAADILQTSMDIDNSYLNDKGIPEAITAYGILYTQNPVEGTSTTLKLTNTSSDVNTDFNYGDVNVGVNFDFTANVGLIEGTRTYFRAFATNATGTGYGAVQSILTAQPATTAAPTTEAPITYYSHRRSNSPSSTECGICPPDYGTDRLFTSPGDTIPTIGMIVYTDSKLDTPFVGVNYWWAIEWDGLSTSTIDMIQIDYNGEVIATGKCSRDCTTTTTTTSTTPEASIYACISAPTSNQGTAGSFTLYCCDGSFVSQKNFGIPVPVNSASVTWTSGVAYGNCYYVDYTHTDLYDDSALPQPLTASVQFTQQTDDDPSPVATKCTICFKPIDSSLGTIWKA